MHDLGARARDLQRALGTAESRAAADEAAAEAERQRQAAEDLARRKEAAERTYLAGAEDATRAVRSLLDTFDKLAELGQALADVHASEIAARLLRPQVIADRLQYTSAKYLRRIFEIPSGEIQIEKAEFVQTERDVIAALHGSQKSIGAPDTPKAA